MLRLRNFDEVEDAYIEREKIASDERKAAMDKNLKIVEVAQRMLDVADLLG